MISLDGVIQAPGGPEEDTSGGFRYGGWTGGYSDEAYSKAVQEELEPAEYLLGRKTFEIWENYWPHHGDFWPAINEGTKYVLSSSRNQSDWNKSVFLKNVSEIKELKKTDGPDIHVWGSSEVVHLLLENDLVDVLRLKIHPLILGKGKKLFADEAQAGAYTLEESTVTSKGVILANYKRAGEVQTKQITV